MQEKSCSVDSLLPSVLKMSYLQVWVKPKHSLSVSERHALLSGNLKLNLIASPVTVFKRSFRQVNGISAERSALHV